MVEMSGVISAAPTPINDRGDVDIDRLIKYCRWLIEDGGCDAVNLLGTTGEAASFSMQQRLNAMTGVARSGLPMSRFMVGTGAAAFSDTITLTRTASELGYAGALIVPPFYYKGIGVDDLIVYVQKIIDTVLFGDTGVYLYHIPQLSGVPYTFDAVERLVNANPQVVRGLKDSSGDLIYAKELVRRVPNIAVFPSSEGTLATADDYGFAGCISATTNVSGVFAQVAWKYRGTEKGREAGAKALFIREILSKFPLVPAVKWAVSSIHSDESWRKLQPPLSSLNSEQGNALESLLATAI